MPVAKAVKVLTPPHLTLNEVYLGRSVCYYLAMTYCSGLIMFKMYRSVIVFSLVFLFACQNNRTTNLYVEPTTETLVSGPRGV